MSQNRFIAEKKNRGGKNVKKEKRKDSSITLLKKASEVCKWGGVVLLYLTWIFLFIEQTILFINRNSDGSYFELFTLLEKITASIFICSELTNIILQIEWGYVFILQKVKNISGSFRKGAFVLGTIVLLLGTIIINIMAIMYCERTGWRELL